MAFVRGPRGHEYFLGWFDSDLEVRARARAAASSRDARQLYHGSTGSPRQACKAHDEMAVRMHGDQAATNFEHDPKRLPEYCAMLAVRDAPPPKRARHDATTRASSPSRAHSPPKPAHRSIASRTLRQGPNGSAPTRGLNRTFAVAVELLEHTCGARPGGRLSCHAPCHARPAKRRAARTRGDRSSRRSGIGRLA